MVETAVTPAEAASQKALDAMYACLEAGQSFRLEAGAGAGKTYSLVKALRFLVQRNQRLLSRRHQQIACITFTNVAKEEIEARTDRSPLIYCDTTHAFCWSLIGSFQHELRARIMAMPVWDERITEAGGLGDATVEYNLGHRAIRDGRVTLHHDDILALTIALMEKVKFRRLMTDRFPIILIDEYQDTNAGWVEAIKTHLLGQSGAPVFGLFGDHWQKIYGDGCGSVDHPALKEIGKEANFRSVPAVVACLNRMRPQLPQFVQDPAAPGRVRVFHTNSWLGQRQTGPHWGGDLPRVAAHDALERVKKLLQADDWDFSATKTKILMLTHRALASEQGYATLPTIFRFNDAFAKMEHPHIAFLVKELEPACEAFIDRKYGAMFDALGGSVPPIRTTADKTGWSTAMERLVVLREAGTVGAVIDHLRRVRRPRLPDAVEDREHELQSFDRNAGVDMPPALLELEAFRAVPYAEVVSLRRYHVGHSPFETKHGVKGAEFENVLVVVGRGWNIYNFREMLELAGREVPANRHANFERNRNLFYVVCSRAKTRLAILFTQELSADALATLENWFGADTIQRLAP